MANNISLSEILHTRPAVVPTIYGYILPDVKDPEGYIKIGYTDRKDTETRIREQLHAAAINFKVLFKESAMRPDGTCFTDKDVRVRTETSGSAARVRMRWRRSKSCARKHGSRNSALGIFPCGASSKPLSR